ncbi:MAG: XTP/dITP diphosphatase [Theionarchaea archaeon]|nr:XTP/dITP diphosphatase [Theionarchaea archaeon]
MLSFITSNRNKFEEIHRMTQIEIEQIPLNYPEIQADSLEAVAEFGIEFCYSETKAPCFLEDSGLFIDVLLGFPGVYSQYVFKTVGCKGILNLLHNREDRKAYFKSVIAYRDESGITFFTGEVQGSIALTQKGEEGFGFDPLFIPEGEGRTFAQMKTEEKNLYSHRGKAFKTFIKYLEQVR